MPPSDTWSDVGLNHSSTNYITISLRWCCASVTEGSAEVAQLSVQDFKPLFNLQLMAKMQIMVLTVGYVRLIIWKYLIKATKPGKK